MNEPQRINLNAIVLILLNIIWDYLPDIYQLFVLTIEGRDVIKTYTHMQYISFK